MAAPAGEKNLNVDSFSNDGSESQCLATLVDLGSIESKRYYLSRRTVLEMLRDRGYDVPFSELNASLADFRAIFGEQPDLNSLRLCFPLISNPLTEILVIFLGPQEVKVAGIRTLSCQIPNKESLNSVMLILQSKLNSYARKELEKFPCRVEIFHITDLLVNITKHILMPKYEILTDEEKELLLYKHKVESKQLPLILETDAIARYYGLKKEQVVKVTYRDEVVGHLETYRCVQ